MAQDARKHTTLGVGEAPTRAAIAAGIFSVNDVIPVANQTEQVQTAAAVAAAGVALASSPIVTIRGDAPGLHKIEYSINGVAFLPASGVLHFASLTARDTWTTQNAVVLTLGDVCWVGAKDYSWTGTAWVLRASAARLVKTNTQTMGAVGSANAIAWTGDQRTSGMWAADKPTKLFPNRAGLWRIHARTGVGVYSSGDFAQLRIGLNGAAPEETEDRRYGGTAGTLLQSSDTVQITNPGTDYVEAYTFATQAGAGLEQTRTLLTAEFVG